MFGQGIAGDGEVGLDHLEGVTGAALFFLEDEADAGFFDGGADTVGFVADDAVDVVGRDDGFGCGDDVEEEGTAADLVEDFGAFAFEPRALACGHDGDGESFGVHRDIVSCPVEGAEVVEMLRRVGSFESRGGFVVACGDFGLGGAGLRFRGELRIRLLR